MLLGTALGGPGGQKALLSRRFKGNLGNFRKSGNEKNGEKISHRRFGADFGGPFYAVFSREPRKTTKSCAREFPKNKKMQKMQKQVFGHVLVEEAKLAETSTQFLGIPFGAVSAQSQVLSLENLFSSKKRNGCVVFSDPAECADFLGGL